LFSLYRSNPNLNYDATIANKMMQFSGISYCIGHGSCVQDWNCELCNQVRNITHVQTLSTYAGYLDVGGSQTGFVAYDQIAKAIVITFTGTHNDNGWLIDIDMSQTLYTAGGCKGCWIHKGFHILYSSFHNDMWRAINSIASKESIDDLHTIPFYITGHSLGAAIATLCALDFKLNNYTVSSLYNFGSPRVGNVQFATFVNKTLTDVFRVTHYHDPVPLIPFTDTLGHDYHHVPREYWYKEDSSSHVVCKDNGEDSNCIDSVQYHCCEWNVFDHLHYLNVDLTKDNCGQKCPNYSSHVSEKYAEKLMRLFCGCSLSNALKINNSVIHYCLLDPKSKTSPNIYNTSELKGRNIEDIEKYYKQELFKYYKHNITHIYDNICTFDDKLTSKL